MNIEQNLRDQIYNKFDFIQTKVESFKIEPFFSEEIHSRNNRYQNIISKEENNILRVMAKLIAYSNNAISDSVTGMLGTGNYERIFHRFDLNHVANLNPDLMITNEWHNLKAVRFKKKIHAIIKCANLLVKNHKGNPTIESLHQNYNIPISLRCENDVDEFWIQFNKIHAEYDKLSMPYFRKITTLLHLLLHVGYPCVKPDLIVMKLAASLGIVRARSNHNTYNNEERKLVVKVIQQYCLLKNINPAVMDFYILIYGKQTDAQNYVVPAFYSS